MGTLDAAALQASLFSSKVQSAGRSVGAGPRDAMVDEVEPLDPGLWFGRIEMIARGELRSVENALRHASHLLQLAPIPLRSVFDLTIDEETFEALLEVGQFDAAARHLVRRPAILAIGRDGDGPIEARISCPVLDRTTRATGDTEAETVLNAWATYWLVLRAELGEGLVDLAHQNHIVPSERPRPSSVH
jgi:hypothetical protein